MEVIRGSASFHVFFYTSVKSWTCLWWNRRRTSRLCTTCRCINIWLSRSNTNIGGLCAAPKPLGCKFKLVSHFHCLPKEQETCSYTASDEPPLRSATFMARDTSAGGLFKQFGWKSSTFSAADFVSALVTCKRFVCLGFT